jgi:hypothetical protein
MILDVYLKSYIIKYANSPDYLKQVNELSSIAELLKKDVASEEALDKLLSILKECFGVKQEGQFYVRNREEIS